MIYGIIIIYKKLECKHKIYIKNFVTIVGLWPIFWTCKVWHGHGFLGFASLLTTHLIQFKKILCLLIGII